ncbi:MAG: DsbA family protein [Nanoarchaeota archaeon]
MTEGIEEEKKVTFTLSKSTVWMILSIVLAISLIGTLVFTGVLGGITGTSGSTLDFQNDGGIQKLKVTAPTDAHTKGSADAPITIIEFSDFECPFCSRFYTDTLPSLQSDWIDTGKAKLMYRQYPLSFHPQAMPAARASECAADQGKFWEYHNKIFDNQASLATPGIFSQWAQELELNVEDFDTCYESNKHDGRINKDTADGNTVGVSGTPSFLIGNDKDGYQLVVGAQPYVVFKQVLESQ